MIVPETPHPSFHTLSHLPMATKSSNSSSLPPFHHSDAYGSPSSTSLSPSLFSLCKFSLHLSYLILFICQPSIIICCFWRDVSIKMSAVKAGRKHHDKSWLNRYFVYLHKDLCTASLWTTQRRISPGRNQNLLQIIAVEQREKEPGCPDRILATGT